MSGLYYVPSLSHPSNDVSHKELTKVLSGTTAEKLTSARTMFATASVTGKQGNDTDNAEDIFLGWNETNQPIRIPSGQTVTIEADKNGLPNNLEKIWLRGASGDGVVVNYV